MRLPCRSDSLAELLNVLFHAAVTMGCGGRLSACADRHAGASCYEQWWSPLT